MKVKNTKDVPTSERHEATRSVVSRALYCASVRGVIEGKALRSFLRWLNETLMGHRTRDLAVGARTLGYWKGSLQ